MKRPPAVHEFKPDHTDGRIIGPAPADLGLGRYKRIWQMLISGCIIGLLATLLITTYFKAQVPARLTDCMGRVRVLGNALEMYRDDYGSRLPPGPIWRWAISDYVDKVGGATEGVEDIGRRARPRGFSSPMRCLANHTTIPISYFYLDPAELSAYATLADESSLPVLVDEINHRRVVVLRADSSCQAVDRLQWVNERRDVYHISRRPDWERTFAYEALPPPPSARAASAAP
jgi:type II secretory pathway pseudopilin PulG